MVRIAGVDVPDRKKAHVALRSIYGVGPVIASEILVKADIDPESPPRMNELSEAQVDRIREVLGDYTSEGDLRREVNQNIRRLIEIGSYRGLRHRPAPGPLISTSTWRNPWSIPLRAACSAALWAAKAVPLRDPLKPTVPALAEEITLPCGSVMLTRVLLNVEYI